MAGRAPTRRPSVHQLGDGLWHCWVTVGVRDNGRPLRRHVKRASAAEVVDAVAALEARVRAGERLPARSVTVAEWLEWWLENVVRPARAPKTVAAYRPIIRVHLVPRIGRYRLDGGRNALEPEHLQAAYADLGRTLAASYVLQCHRVLHRALKVAVRYGRASRNVADYVDAPSARRRRRHALDLDAVRAILTTVAGDRDRVRWLLAILLGLRQGEVLGLRWADVHLDGPAPHLELSAQAQRRTWEHGCGDPQACARPHCRTEPCHGTWEHGCGGTCGYVQGWRCPQRRAGQCRRHRGAACPPPCPPGCTGHARLCPQRRGGGVVLADMKTEDSEAGLPLVPELAAALAAHRVDQRQQRQVAGPAWEDHDLVICTPAGRPVDPRRDHEAWEALLARAGLPDAPLHAARHTAATLLLATGTDIAIVQTILRHTDIRTTRGYVDVARDMQAAAVARYAAALFGQSPPIGGAPGEH